MAGKAEGRMGVGSLNMAKKLAPSAVVSAGSHGSQRSQQWGPGAQVWIPGQSLRPLRGVAGCLGGGGGTGGWLDGGETVQLPKEGCGDLNGVRAGGPDGTRKGVYPSCGLMVGEGP